MLTLDLAIEKIKQLPPEKQQKVFQLIEYLEGKPEKAQKTLAEVAHEFAGCLDSDIDDLSYNPQKSPEAEDFFAIAGIWENRDINVDSIRQQAWREQD